jgi:hypothetical protein
VRKSALQLKNSQLVRLPVSKLVRNVPWVSSIEMSPSEREAVRLWELVENRSVVFQGAVGARQDGQKLWLTLSGATFYTWRGVAGNPNGDVEGRVQPGGVVFYFPWADGNEQPYVLEQLPTSRAFLVSGDVVATGAANRFAGTLSGQIWIYETGNIFGVSAIAWCLSTSHQFVLSR